MTTTVLFTNLLTGEVIGEIANDSVSYDEILSAPGAINLTGPLRQEAADAAVAIVTEENLLEAGSGLFVIRDNVPIWGGILWDLDGDVDTNTLTLSGEGFHSYARHRNLESDVTFVGIDQAKIAHDVVAHMQAFPAGDVGIVTDPAPLATGVTRDRTYKGYALAPYSRLLENLSDLEDGIDFRYRAQYGASNPEVAFQVLYPKSGRVSDLVFELGRNCRLATFATSGRTVANRVHGTGSGTGPARQIVTEADGPALTTRPVLQAIEPRPNVTEAATLRDHARRRLSLGRYPVKRLTVELFEGSTIKVGAFEIGDRVYAHGSHGRYQVDGLFRITQISTTSTKGFGDSVKVTLADVRAFQ